MRNFLLYIMLLAFVLASCLGEDEYTSSPNARLFCAVDTLSLDTVYAGELTNTFKFWVYNPEKKAQIIQSVILEKGTASAYRINVDGEPSMNGVVNPFDILGGDSMYVFVSLMPQIANQDTPQEIKDKVIITPASGKSLEVNLSAFSQDVVSLHGLVVDQDMVLDAKRPYHIYDSLYVKPGATLTIKPGVRLHFKANAGLKVAGSLVAEGTIGEPIVMRGDRLGFMFPDQSYDRVPGQWQGLEFLSGSTGNRLNFCDIHSSKFGIKAIESEIRIENSILHNVADNLLTLRKSECYFGNSQLTNAGLDCVNIIGGSYMFVHCTIANFQHISTGHADSGVALRFGNLEGKEVCPLKQMDFYNCIITGWNEDEIMGEDCSTKDETFDFLYSFNNCLLCTPQSDGINQVNCIWEEDGNKDGRIDSRREKNFSPEFDPKTLKCYFTLSENSLAAGNADILVTQSTYTRDLNGNFRLDDNKSDMGCYEYVGPNTQ